MTGQRGVTDPDPGRVKRARERKGCSRASLARAITERLRRPICTARTIQKIETGLPVDPARYRPVMVELELATEPSREAPVPNQAPGEWVRELREAHGIQPTTFCLHAHYPDSTRRMSRDTLKAIEQGRRRLPTLPMLDAIATGFERCRVEVDKSHLENAWVLYEEPSVIADGWGPEFLELRERMHQQRWAFAGAAEGLKVLASHLSQLNLAPDNLGRTDEARDRTPRA